MSQDRFTLFEKVTTGKLMEAISKSMDDFLYIFDIQNSKLELSEAADGSLYDTRQIFG